MCRFYLNSSEERSNKNRPRPVSYSVSIRVKLARSALRRILPGLSPQEPRRGVLAAGSLQGWASGWAACRGRPLSRAAARFARSHSQLVGVSEERKGWDARGLITLNPKLLDIRVVKGWATGSRQLGSAE